MKLPPNLPDKPGVYRFKDHDDEIIYIGKAKSIRKRVGSYFTGEDRQQDKIRIMLRRASDLDFILTATEKGALILEATLIKQYRPRYNTRLTDDKSYPYIRVSADPYPSISIVRRTDEAGSYYGPFTDLRGIKRVFKLLRQIFRVRTCKKMKEGGCLNRELDLCLAPCVNEVEPEMYQGRVLSVIRILEGKIKDVLDELEISMWDAAEKLNFERAASDRDYIEGLESLISDLRLETEREDMDVIGLKETEEGSISLLIFMVRDGRIAGRESFLIEERVDIDDLITSLITQYYITSSIIPARIILPMMPAEVKILEEWLSEKASGSVAISCPASEWEDKLLELATRGAGFIKPLKKEETGCADEFKRVLRLEQKIDRIEAFDISNIGGLYAVGSMVVFEGGVARNQEYKRFKIKTVERIDDLRMMEEVIERRLKNRLLPLPDLMMVDGGRAQLNVAQRAIMEAGYDIPVIGLAKRFEEIYIPGKKQPIRLDDSSPLLKLLKKVRDEAHRFAIRYHRQLRDDDLKRSVLDGIDGIGKQRRLALLKHFESVDAIRSATYDEIMAVAEFGKKSAQKVYDALHNLD